MKWFLFLFLLLSMGVIQAKASDKTQPMQIEAETMTYDDLKQMGTFSGHVVLTQGTIRFKGDRLIVKTLADGHRFVTFYAAPTDVVTFQQQQEAKENIWVKGHAGRIEYDEKTEVVKLFSNAQVRRLVNQITTDQVNGAFISYDMHQAFYAVYNTETGTHVLGAGRVKAVIQPRDKTSS